MKSLKNHISVIIPLFILLFSFEFAVMLDRVVKNYEENLFNDYSIVIASMSKLDEENLKKEIPLIKKLEPLSTKKVIDKFKNDFSPANLAYLRSSLPKFYSVKLKYPPDEKTLEEIEKKLRSIPSITKVETFEKSYTKIYMMLNFSKVISNIFTIFIFIISILLIFKQMEIWTLEHQERMYIMGLFGSPFWMKSAVLYKLVFIDSIISAVGVGLFFYFVPKTQKFQEIMKSIGLDFSGFRLLDDMSLLLGISIFITIFSVTLVILRQRTELR
ncbi:MAG: hypothetical protein GXO31_01475 [Epsilonproteobacteria bacterium]|nr:hypothetical protein [Campylobacterota bacterium]